jgi:hypothetical protein
MASQKSCGRIAIAKGEDEDENITPYREEE